MSIERRRPSALSPSSCDQGPQGILTGARILVVEDEFMIAMQLQSIFEDEGAEVIGPFYTLADARKHAEHDEITAATLDINLGRDSAVPVASVLSGRHIPFIFYSVQQPDDSTASGWAHIRLISKPADASVLVEAVASLLPAEARAE